MRLCLYTGYTTHPTYKFVRSRLITDSKLVEKLNHDLAQLPVQHGAVNCPYYDGSLAFMLIAYPSHRHLTVSVELGGCEGVTNGAVNRTASGFGTPPEPASLLVPQLKRLLNRRP